MINWGRLVRTALDNGVTYTEFWGMSVRAVRVLQDIRQKDLARQRVAAKRPAKVDVIDTQRLSRLPIN